NMPAGAHFTVDINATNPANPIRNIHLWMPDYEGHSLVGAGLGNPSDASPFHPAFLQRLDPFNTVRFMDWASTNDSDIVSWNDRRTPTAMSQADGEYQYYHTNGVALEYQIELANEIDANPWFNMPHQANDDYVRRFATMVRDTLDPQLKIYVEWSNEVWNSLFEVNHWIQDELGRPENQGQNFFSFVGHEIRRDFDIWSDVFAGQTDRLVRVVAGQQANPYILEQLLLNVGDHVDAVSASAYAGIDYNSALAFGASTTPDDLVNFLEQSSIPWALARLADHRRLADRFEDIWGKNLSLVTYESGSHVIGNPNPFGWTAAGPAAAAAMHHPRMYQVYQTLLEGVRDIGVDLYNEFNFTSAASVNFYGNYGLMHRQDQPLGELPQLRAIYDHLEANRTAVAPLEVASITPVTPGLRNTSIASIDVTFSRAIDPATFDWRDVMLTLDGGPNRMTRVQTVTPLSGNTFRIGNLARITNSTGTYRLTVQAGGVLDQTARAGAGTQSTSWITDVSAPQTNAVSVDRSSGVWNVAMSGRDVGAAGLASFDLWVSVDGAAPRQIGRTNAGAANADGFSQATLPFRPISDGNVHSYRFYSIGRDGFGKTESAPATPADVLVSAAVRPVLVTQFDVESGAVQRSRVSSLVLTFDSADVVPLMVATIGDGTSTNDAFRLIRHGLDGQGAATISLVGRTAANGNSVVFDFGPTGLTSDGYYELQFDGDGNGTLESSRRFYRLKGDLNGDRRVDSQDEVVLGRFLGQVGVGHFADLNGNGVIDLKDRNSLRTLFGRTLQVGLTVDD
ncbi:MAG: Ig-like domain-containing protein, partial [Planctomycetota bacterium]|nr:Ig-like domain-containing protein [Planctomycetota bacterium]